MNLINQINEFLAKSLGLLNALLAILLVGFALMMGVWCSEQAESSSACWSGRPWPFWCADCWAILINIRGPAGRVA